MAVSFKFGYEYSIADDTKAAARSKLKLHQKQNKIWWKTIFNMADGIFTPCNVTWSWHWFCQVAAPCNVACSSGIVTLNSPSGSTLQCDTWLWDDMLLNSPGGSTLQWHIALESWHWICQVAAPCSVAGCCGMTCHWICPNVRHIGILHLISISTKSSQLTCHSATVSDILSKSDHLRQKKMTSCPLSRWRISAISDFMDPIMGSLKSPITTY